MIEYTMIALYEDVTFATSRTQAEIQTDLDAKADDGFEVVGANQHWVLLAREFAAATPT